MAELQVRGCAISKSADYPSQLANVKRCTNRQQTGKNSSHFVWQLRDRFDDDGCLVG